VSKLKLSGNENGVVTLVRDEDLRNIAITKSGCAFADQYLDPDSALPKRDGKSEQLILIE